MQVAIDFYSEDPANRSIGATGQGRYAQTRGKALGSSEQAKIAWMQFQRQVRGIKGAIYSKALRKVMMRGAQVTVAHLKQAARGAFDVDRFVSEKELQYSQRNDPRPVTPLIKAIKAKLGRFEYGATALVLLRSKLPGHRAARHAWLVDAGHAGPLPESPRTPAHPWIEAGFAASEIPRQEAMIQRFRQLMPEIIEEVRRLREQGAIS